MMYQENFVVAVKVNGKVLREQGDVIKMPFGTEYNILLKNLSSQKALAHVEIDGEDVLDGNGLIIKPDSSLELEGFMKGSTAEKRFKFIERTEKIEEHRGIRPEDGLIRVEYQFEQKPPQITYTYTYPRTCHYWYRYPWDYWCYYDDNSGEFEISNNYSDGDFTLTGANSSGMSKGCSSGEINCFNSVSQTPVNDAGITVHGDNIKQDFYAGYIGTLENVSHVIVLKLSGYKKDSQAIEKPVFVREKLVCPTCGTKNSSKNRFCSECGTNLE